MFNLVNLACLGRFNRLSFPTRSTVTTASSIQHPVSSNHIPTSGIQKFAITIILCCFALTANAQDNSPIYKDFESWHKIAVRKKLNKDWNLKLNQNLRLKDNASTVKVIFTQVAINYEVSKKMTVEAGYRFIVPTNEDFRHRIHLVASYKISPKRWDIGYRLKLDNETEDWGYFDHRLRNRLTIGYNIRKWKFDPELGVELFYQYQNDYQGFNRLRYTLKTTYKINKQFTLEIGAGLQRGFAVPRPKQTGIFFLNLDYKL